MQCLCQNTQKRQQQYFDKLTFIIHTSKMSHCAFQKERTKMGRFSITVFNQACFEGKLGVYAVSYRDLPISTTALKYAFNEWIYYCSYYPISIALSNLYVVRLSSYTFDTTQEKPQVTSDFP